MWLLIQENQLELVTLETTLERMLVRQNTPKKISHIDHISNSLLEDLKNSK